MENKPVDHTTEAKKEKQNDELDRVFGMLERSVDEMNKSSRTRGFIEGSLVTLGGVAVTGLVVLSIIKQKK